MTRITGIVSSTLPVSCATSSPLIGRMISAPICWALRASLTRDETQTASCSAASAASGPSRKTIASDRGVSRIEKTPGRASSGHAGDVGREAGDRQHQRRQQRAEHLGGEQLEGRDRRRQQRLERPRLLLADDAVGGDRHRAGDRRQDEQHAGTAGRSTPGRRLPGRAPASPAGPGTSRAPSRSRSSPTSRSPATYGNDDGDEERQQRSRRTPVSTAGRNTAGFCRRSASSLASSARTRVMRGCSCSSSRR